MPNPETIIRQFIANFVIKERRERSLLELSTPKRRASFIRRFNHTWENVVQMKYLHKIEKEFTYPEDIQELLGFKEKDLCYVISHYEDVDNQILTFAEAFDAIYGRGFASIIMNLSATTIYLQTEQVQGPPNRFIGMRIDK
ncbi:hypothetical protein QNI19_35645 [Cytophagaceae bacterium DM2B3-1]|uniref:Uncharacterized protein n=1 Tax=Xanthocytophaga flava TaxID=3048013 RepID=A0ABT7CX76_9BACT|nr:hypothetical protein [Xanthocytophaga flavus]MDJ1473342.1 hypothetical protein [Xanthocytophaga flavus]MDJ1498323.1 hypothetical protein [Xanthocytophaga flavus]